VSAGDSRSGAVAPSDAELAVLVEHLVGELWWQVSSELPSELSRTSASILKNLREHGPQRVTSLAAREQVAQPTMSVIIKRLGARGLVERGVDPEDRRATLVAITSLGLETLSERAQLRSRWFAARLAGLEGDDRRAVAAAVSKLMETFG
jgi:DNA-binding MarR family transcriptional regulator